MICINYYSQSSDVLMEECLNAPNGEILPAISINESNCSQSGEVPLKSSFDDKQRSISSETETHGIL